VLRYALLFLALAAALGAGAMACGPSFQATYECDVRFEHCYALDETDAAEAVKHQCWHDWLAGYTFGQSRDRVEFASLRVHALSVASGPADDDPPPPAPTRSVVAPLPTSAFAPPPPVASPDGTAVASSSAPPAATRPPGARVPGADCADRCEARWTGCRSGCSGATCEHCDRTYRACMPACFRDDGRGAHPAGR
jgi:hypothetical protein